MVPAKQNGSTVKPYVDAHKSAHCSFLFLLPSPDMRYLLPAAAGLLASAAAAAAEGADADEELNTPSPSFHSSSCRLTRCWRACCLL